MVIGLASTINILRTCLYVKIYLFISRSIVVIQIFNFCKNSFLLTSSILSVLYVKTYCGERINRGNKAKIIDMIEEK